MYVPDELRAYTYDDQAERAAKRLHRILGKTDRKWMNKPLFKGDGRSLFTGADGCVYEVTSPSNTPGYWYLSKYNLRFYVCHKCKGYFSYGNVITVVKSGQSTEEIEGLKEQLETGSE